MIDVVETFEIGTARGPWKAWHLTWTCAWFWIGYTHQKRSLLS